MSAPLAAPQIFIQTVDLLDKAQVASQAKIPKNMNDAGSINRADKMVVYFNDEDTTKVVAILDTIYQMHASAFMAGTPRFTVKMRDAQGSELTGVGFGEEPLKHSSFGSERADVLTRVVQAATLQGKKLEDPSFDFEQIFREYAASSQIDPDNFAFNSPDRAGQFSEIRRRARLTPPH